MRPPLRLLLCVDYAPLRTALAQGVAGVGFAVVEADGLAAALAQGRMAGCELAVVGLFRRGSDTHGAVRQLEAMLPQASVLVLRGCSEGIACDDCDVQAAVRSVLGAGLLIRLADSLHSAATVRAEPLRFGELELIPAQCRATINGLDLGFTPCEYRILEHLALRRGEVVTIQELQRGIARSEQGASSNVVAQWISRVRTKVRLHGGGDPIETRRGLGYAFTA